MPYFVRFGLLQWRQVRVMAIIVPCFSVSCEADNMPRHSRNDHYPRLLKGCKNDVRRFVRVFQGHTAEADENR